MSARQRGVALITALVVLAIAAGMSAAMIWQTGLDERRTATLVQGDQAMEYALGAEAWAGQILSRAARKNQGVTALSQDWAQQLPPLPVDGGQIQGRIEDLQGRFNVNNLVNAQGVIQAPVVEQFRRLLQALELDPAIADAAADWMSPGTGASQGGAKDDYYSRLQPAYLTSGVPMSSISEMLLVKGVTPQVYARLAPYLSALPPSLGGGATTVNVNTASGPVLESLDPHITPDVASQVIGERGSVVFNTGNPPQAFTAGNLAPKGIGYDSQYFLVTVDAEIGTTHVTLYSLLLRNGVNVTTVRRTLGTL
ncbi:MAG TPA: type II secretion system minor pseudopilin GspK [Gammaproteobacteria bacterium]